MQVRLHIPKSVEWAAWVLGFALLSYVVFNWGRTAYVQAEGRTELASLVIPHTVRAPREGAVVGSIALPSLHIDSIILEGSTENTLAVGVGHVTGTGYPGSPGNVVLAGHRDSFFLPLEKAKVGDRIEVSARGVATAYLVESTRVVDPSDLSVISPSTRETVTLITCYPFRYIGPAPQRFVVRGVKAPPGAAK
jgi:LPXTG-site transpeptidase (sortase) family protein